MRPLTSNCFNSYYHSNEKNIPYYFKKVNEFRLSEITTIKTIPDKQRATLFCKLTLAYKIGNWYICVTNSPKASFYFSKISVSPCL